MKLETAILKRWAVSLIVGSLFWGLVNNIGIGSIYLLVSSIFSLPYLLAVLLLARSKTKKKFFWLYIVNTASFVVTTILLYITPSTIPYFSFTIVPYYICGMILFMFYETKLIEKEKLIQE